MIQTYAERGMANRQALIKVVLFLIIVGTFVIIASSTDFYPSRYRTRSLEISIFWIVVSALGHITSIVLFLLSFFWSFRDEITISAESINRGDNVLIRFHDVAKFRIQGDSSGGLFNVSFRKSTGSLVSLRLYLNQKQKKFLIESVGNDKLTWTSP